MQTKGKKICTKRKGNRELLRLLDWLLKATLSQPLRERRRNDKNAVSRSFTLKRQKDRRQAKSRQFLTKKKKKKKKRKELNSYLNVCFD